MTTFAEIREEALARTLASDRVEPYELSTVHLRLVKKHNREAARLYPGIEPLPEWETVLFVWIEEPPHREEVCRMRWTSEEEARDRHAKWLELIRALRRARL